MCVCEMKEGIQLIVLLYKLRVRVYACGCYECACPL